MRNDVGMMVAAIAASFGQQLIPIDDLLNKPIQEPMVRDPKIDAERLALAEAKRARRAQKRLKELK